MSRSDQWACSSGWAVASGAIFMVAHQAGLGLARDMTFYCLLVGIVFALWGLIEKEPSHD